MIETSIPLYLVHSLFSVFLYFLLTPYVSTLISLFYIMSLLNDLYNTIRHLTSNIICYFIKSKSKNMFIRNSRWVPFYKSECIFCDWTELPLQLQYITGIWPSFFKVFKQYRFLCCAEFIPNQARIFIYTFPVEVHSANEHECLILWNNLSSVKHVVKASLKKLETQWYLMKLSVWMMCDVLF